MSPVEAFAIGIKSFDRQKVCLIAWSSHLNLLILFLRVKGQIKAVHSWSFDFYILEVTLIPWSALKKADLIQFWFRLEHTSDCSLKYKTHEHLVGALLRQDMNKNFL